MRKSFLFFALIAMVCGISLNSCKNNTPPDPNEGKVDPSTIASANLVAYWNFDKTAKDAVGQRGDASSAISYVTGRRGEALQAGANSYISFNVPATDKLATLKEFTIAMWLKAPKLTNGVPCFFQLSSGTTWNGEFAFFQDNLGDNTRDSLRLKAVFTKQGVNWAGQWIDLSKPSFVADKWFHYVVNYSAATSTATIYINGGDDKIVTTSAYDLTTRYADDPGDANNINGAPKLGDLNLGLTAGKGAIGNWVNLVFPGLSDVQTWTIPFAGQIDELRFYDKALSDQEVKALYEAEVTQLNP